MDADGNGLVKIKEVNEFTRAKPPSLSLMEWIAYRSYGWSITSYLYKLRIQYMIEVMLAVDSPDMEDPILVKVVHTVMSHHEKQLAAVLDRLKYNVTEDGITLLSSVNGTESFEMGSELESFLLPVLFLLLFRHYELLKLSAKYVLNEDEIGRNAVTAIAVIINAVVNRVTSLAEHFRKMQLDVRQQFDTFANGMYKGIFRIHTSNMSFTEIQDEATVPQNTLWTLHNLLQSFDCRENKLFNELNLSPNTLRPDLAHYGCLPIFSTAGSDSAAGSVAAENNCLRHDDYVSLLRLREKYGVQFVRSWNREVDVEHPRASWVSSEVSHKFIKCDGCRSAVSGTRYKCVQCADFDYCDTCHANLPPIPPEDPVLALHDASHDYLAVNQAAPTLILNMMRHGLQSRERVVVISLLTLGVSEAKENANDLAALIRFCSDPSDEVRLEAVERAEAFLDSLGDEGQTYKESLLSFVAVTDAWTMDTLREWHRNLLSLRYANWNESSKPDYYGEENESQEDLSDTDDLAHVTSAHSDGAVQDEAALAAEGPLTEDSQPGDTMEGLAKFELDGGNIEQNIDDPGRVQTMGEQQDIATAATEESSELEDEAEPSTRICDGPCKKPIAGDSYRCLLCEDCVLCSDCALSDAVIGNFNAPHRPIHVMIVIPGTSTVHEGTGTDLGGTVDPSTLVSHVAYTSADIEHLEARMNSMEEKLNDTTRQVSAILAGMTELLARPGTSETP
ncbi:hypothetical protein OH76DRAFT_1483332 [Lentinus brumalis]|uniref:ZZ-type domain-containing protein n=1 Tax=Lentinus brumalis TaxID=2498619 RepID=A0A371D997_9APHY|nr:hypothetical protein OH76DRAFT_1483332 [Polyporus brumalis]